jgi:hypothetical protein
MDGEKLSKNLSVFLQHIDSIRDTLPMIMLLLRPYNKKTNDSYLKFLKNNVKEIEDDDGNKRLLLKAEESKLYETLQKNATISSIAEKIIPDSIFVSLISQYDAFLNRLLRAIFEIKPDILNASDRNILFSQLIEMGSIDYAREYVIEKEIETFLRKSHSEQFDYLENRLGMKLREKLPCWQKFVELTERRNLLVHCDGKVSNQYIKNCQEHGCQLGEIKLGDRLGVPPDYFSKSYKCLYEISVKLTHTIWRKLLKSDLKLADRDLNIICYDLITSRSFELADNLLTFAVDQKKHFNEAFKNVIIINRTLSLYLQGKKDEANQILDSKDWSASSDDFKLAYAILKEDFREAYALMTKIGDNGEVDIFEYKLWPLFNKIREEKEFKDTFKTIFKKEYTVLEIPKRPIQELINKEIKKNKDLKNKTVKKVFTEKELRNK